MIPIQLTIQGLYSYQEKQTIDFTKLTGASLFGIFGTVGSGKSSILEAIIYALYGRTSRLNLAGDNRYYNMMNLKSDQLLIDFTFIAGKEQTKYRSVIKGKRNSKNFDDVKTLDRSSYKNENNEWIPVEATELEQAVGLSYDNFRRTIIIPQGQFQEFLQLGNKDRTQMMKELFDLGKYEFSGKVSALETKNNAQKQHIDGQLQQLVEINESLIDAQQQELNILQNELIQLDNKYKTYQQKAEELNNLQVLVQKKSNTEQEFKTLLNQEPEYRKLENLISEYELCLAHFKLILNNLDDCESRKNHKIKQIEQERHQLKVLEEVIQSIDQEINKIRPAYENREVLKKQAQDLLYISKVKNLEEVINKNHIRLLKGASILESTKNSIADLSKNKAELEVLVRRLKFDLPDMTIMVSAMEWHSKNSNLSKQKTDIEAQLNKYNKEAKDLHNLFIKILEDPIFQNLQSKESINSALEILEIENKHLKQQDIILQQEGDDLRLKDQLHKFAVDLKEGKACPLCGSLSHPDVYTIADIHESQFRLKKSRGELANRQESIHNLQLQLNNLQSRIDMNELYQKEWKLRYDDKLEEIKAHANSFHWEKYRVKESLDADFKKANELHAEIKAHENSLEALTIKLNTEQEKKDKYQNELDKITHEITIAKTEAKTLQEQIVDLDIKEYKDIPAPEIEKERNRLLEEHVRLEKSFEKLNKQVEEQRKAAQSHTGTLLSLEKDLSTEMEKLTYITKEIDDTLRKYNYPSVESVRKILNQPIQLEAEKKKLQTFNQQKSLL
ncbi:MAG TPA: SMC family ATPase, partial [Chitinispirillaceae bacterium]|nr:SMC family ATPase [Chitinispirillaceae bacterium]